MRRSLFLSTGRVIQMRLCIRLRRIVCLRRLFPRQAVHLLIPTKVTVPARVLLFLVKCPMEEAQHHTEDSTAKELTQCQANLEGINFHKLKGLSTLVSHYRIHIILIRRVTLVLVGRISLPRSIRGPSLHRIQARPVGGTPKLRVLLFHHLCLLVSRILNTLYSTIPCHSLCPLAFFFANLLIVRPTHSFVVGHADFWRVVSDCVYRRRRCTRLCAKCC